MPWAGPCLTTPTSVQVQPQRTKEARRLGKMDEQAPLPSLQPVHINSRRSVIGGWCCEGGRTFGGLPASQVAGLPPPSRPSGSLRRLQGGPEQGGNGLDEGGGGGDGGPRGEGPPVAAQVPRQPPRSGRQVGGGVSGSHRVGAAVSRSGIGLVVALIQAGVRGGEDCGTVAEAATVGEKKQVQGACGYFEDVHADATTKWRRGGNTGGSNKRSHCLQNQWLVLPQMHSHGT